MNTVLDDNKKVQYKITLRSSATLNCLTFSPVAVFDEWRNYPDECKTESDI